MRKLWKFPFLLGFVALGALLAVGCAWTLQGSPPSSVSLLAFVVVATLLEQNSTKLGAGGLGSTSFVVHLAAALTFGPFWGGILTGSATLIGLMALGMVPEKVAFNVAQRVLSTVLGGLVYLRLGGATPPVSLQESLLPFLMMSGTYFLVNSTAVSAAISIRSARTFREVWNLNSRGVLAYDVAASSIALFLAWVYQDWGLFGLFVAVVPTLVARHTYAMYRDLQESGRELLQVMVKAIEARDPYTSGHSIRVRNLSKAIALELGLPANQLEQVETAALLHDVGKIHEEFAPLLRKEERLTTEEMTLMQTHSTKSAELVGIISKFRGVIQDSVRHHHERWDGKGYPSGLSGENIPLGSRIILISDTIDAMTTDRPYRKRLPVEVVIAELQRCKGTQFEPALVDVVASSVAVRRLISGVPEQEPALPDGQKKAKSPGWRSGALWKPRKAIL